MSDSKWEKLKDNMWKIQFLWLKMQAEIARQQEIEDETINFSPIKNEEDE